MSQIILDKKEMANLTADITKQVDSAIKSALSKNENKILNRTQIANYFNVGANTIDQWVDLGTPYALLGKTKRFSTKSALKWVHEHEVTKQNKKRPIHILNE